MMRRFSMIELDKDVSRARLFSFGENPSTKGTVLYDERSAASVLSVFKTQGVDLVVDLEHLSLDPQNPAYNPDAMGWITGLEATEKGLDALIKWTPEGIERIKNKKQRYLSPTFFVDEEERVIEIVNVALTAQPATHKAPALIAANRIGETMEDFVNALAEMLGLSEEEKTPEMILEKIKAMMSPPEERADDEPEERADDEPKEMTALSNVVKSVVKEVAQLRSEQSRVRVDTLIQNNTDKIPPSLEKWARRLLPDDLEAYLKAAPAIHAPSSTEPSTQETELNPHEQRWSKILGVDPEKLKEFKNGENRN